MSAVRDGSSVKLAITDHGAGIAEAKLEQLAKPFSRAEQASVDFDTQGIGLGLYMNKLIAAYLGGEMSIDSKTGFGTTVSLSLPQDNQVLAPPKQINSEQGQLPESYHPVSHYTPSGGTQPLLG